MAAEKSDPVVSFITLISAGSTVTCFVAVSRARTQSKGIHFFHIHEYRSGHRRSGAGQSCCCTQVPGGTLFLSAWRRHPWGHGQGSGSLSVLGTACTVLQGHHCWEDGQVLPPSAEPQMFQGFTSLPMHRANRISSQCVFVAPASWSLLKHPQGAALGVGLVDGYPSPHQEMPSSCEVVCSLSCSHQHLSWSCRRAFLGSPGSFCARHKSQLGTGLARSVLFVGAAGNYSHT